MKHEKTPFERQLDACLRWASSLQSDLKYLRYLYQNHRIEDAYGYTLHTVKGMEQLGILVRSLPSYTQKPCAKEDVARMVRDAAEVEIGFTEDEWFSMRFPALQPGNELESDLDIRRYLGAPLKEFFATGIRLKYDSHVLIFRHIYDADRPDRVNRDPQSIEVNAIYKMLSQYASTSDSPYGCPSYHCSAAGGKNRTEMYLVPMGDFGRWLIKEAMFPDDGVKIYESMEKAQAAKRKKEPISR